MSDWPILEAAVAVISALAGLIAKLGWDRTRSGNGNGRVVDLQLRQVLESNRDLASAIRDLTDEMRAGEQRTDAGEQRTRDLIGLLVGQLRESHVEDMRELREMLRTAWTGCRYPGPTPRP